jgi:hypothetical protein
MEKSLCERCDTVLGDVVRSPKRGGDMTCYRRSHHYVTVTMLDQMGDKRSDSVDHSIEKNP